MRITGLSLSQIKRNATAARQKGYKMKYFTNCTTAEELKAKYHELLKQYHPDNGGDPEICKQINNEFSEMFARLKNIHRNHEGQTYQKETSETAEQFMDMINRVIHFTGCRIEIIGSWIWISGNTYQYKDQLKALHFGFSKQKTAWYYHEGEYRKHSKKHHSMDDIRSMWGSRDIDPEPDNDNQIAG